MKKTIIALVTIILLSGCQQIMDEMQDDFIDDQLGDQVLYYNPDFDGLDTYHKIAAYINARVSYDYNDNSNHHNNPEETLKTGKGSCGDFSVLFMNIAYYGMHIKMDAVTGIHPTRKVVDGGDINHMAVYYNGQVIEPQNGCISSMEVGYIYYFDDVFGNN